MKLKSKWFWSATLTGVLGAGAAVLAADRPPNIVFLLADDLGYKDVGAFGQDKIQTPNIDKLATQSIKLTTHYAGNTVCAPSRCTLLSSLHPGHAFVRNNGHAPDYALGDHEGQWPVPAGNLVLPLTFHRLGYTQAAFGKWSEGAAASTGNPLKQGLDHFFGYQCQSVAHNYFPKYLWDDGKQVPLNNPDFVEGQPNDGFVGKDYSADIIQQHALQFIRDNKDKPFFLYDFTTLPHPLLQLPEEDLKQYEGKFDDKPLPRANGANGARAPRATYAAMVSKMDKHFGQIVDLIHELNLDDNTIVIFTSDNGAEATDICQYFNSGGVFRGAKGSIYEGGFREPAIVRWPGKIAAGSTSDNVTAFEDWLPTLLTLIGKPQETPAKIDGWNFAPTLLGQPQPERPFLYRESPIGGGEQSVRVGNWKLLRKQIGRSGAEANAASADAAAGGRSDKPRRSYPGAADPEKIAAPGALELYDLATDLSEQDDVAADHPEIVARLAKLLQSQHVKSDIFPIAGLDGAVAQSNAGGKD